MHPTTAELFTETIEKTGHWLQELMQKMDTRSLTRRTPYCARFCMCCATG